MTKNTSNTVTLSRRDWAGFIALSLTVMTLVAAAYLRHDRHITEVLVKQDFMESQMSDMKDRVREIEIALTQRND
jgi:hypothetical protein